MVRGGQLEEALKVGLGEGRPGDLMAEVNPKPMIKVHRRCVG